MDPYKELAAIIENRISNKTAKALSGVTCELGIITSTGLKLDGFKYEIQDYLIAEHLILQETLMTEAGGSDNHTHLVKVPEQLKPLKEGDRVLVVPINGGNDFVVIARVVPNA